MRACVCSYLDVLLDLVSALLMTSEGADCRLWAKVFIFCTVRERKRRGGGQWKLRLKVFATILHGSASHEE